ncbi:MAG: multi-sensor signal transduction histidine kinase [uncultured bacterium]|nr:MAG: multi-sensor signal transduction histidine kinase [uncultured bacterium]
MDTKIILIVEDDEGISQLAKKKLESKGFKVIHSLNGADAFRRKLVNNADLVLLDYQLPDMDGHVFLEELKLRDIRVPFIVITGNGDVQCAVDFMKKGAIDFLMKDKSFWDLLPSSVDKAIRQIDLEARLGEFERVLKESEQQKLVLANSNDAIVVVQDNKNKFFNTKALDLFGYKKEEYESISAFDTIHPYDRQMIQEIFQKNINENDSFSFELRMLDKIGNLKWMHANTVAIIWESKPAILAFIKDITSFKESQTALKFSEKRLEFALEAASDGLWDRDIITGATYFSPRYYNILGYKPYEIPFTYETLIERIHPDDKLEVIDKTSNHYKNSDVNLEIDFRIKTKSGNWLWVTERSKVVERDYNKNPVRVVGSIVDITNRKKNEEKIIQYQQDLEETIEQRTTGLQGINEKLQEEILKHKQTCTLLNSQLKLSQALNSINDFNTALNTLLDSAVLLEDIDCGFIYLKDLNNGNFNLLYFKGFSESLITDNILHLKSNSYIAEIISKNRPFYEEIGEVCQNQCKIFVKEGYQFLAIEPISHEKEIIASLIIFSRSNKFPSNTKKVLEALTSQVCMAISRLKYEEALSRNEKKFRSLVLNIPGVLYRSSFNDNPSMQFVSSEIEKLTGYLVSELLENKVLSYFNIINEGDIDNFWKHINEAYEKNEPYKIEYRIKKQDGSSRWIYDIGRVCKGKKGNSLWLDGELFDITKNKLIIESLHEDILNQNKFIKNSIHAFSQISSKLNKSVNSFSRENELLTQKICDLIASEKQKNKVISIIEENLTPHLKVFENTQEKFNQILLDMEKYISLNHKQYTSQPLDVKSLILEVFEKLNDKIINSQTEIILNDIPNCIGDREQIFSLFYNIIDNSILFSSPKRKNKITISGEIKSDFSIYVIEDNGIGINPDEIKNVFNPFYKTNHKSFVNNSGLGLTLAKKIVSFHEGQISINSDTGIGTTVNISLPKE